MPLQGQLTSRSSTLSPTVCSMPSPTDFKKHFELGKGTQVGREFIVQSSQVSHIVREENERYEFPITLTLEHVKGGAIKQQPALTAFKHHVQQAHLIYSAYGSPYTCTVGSIKASKAEDDEGLVRVTCLGKAVRRRDLPTLKEVKEQERQQAGQSEELSPEDEELLGGMRVIKSRFGSSKCSQCGETIDPGVKIAKPKEEGGRGGWAHARCAVEAIKNSGAQGPSTPKKRTRGKPGAARGQNKRARGNAAPAGAPQPKAESTPAAGARKRRRGERPAEEEGQEEMKPAKARSRRRSKG